MCVNQKCMSVDSLRAGISKCPQDCNGNGVCNSLGHCHCKDGFSPPYCDYPGPGGSEDSGPASDPNARKDFVKAMYIIFLGVIPTIAIIALLFYYPRYHLKFKWPTTGGSTYVFNCFSSLKHALVSACCNRKHKNHVPSISQRVSNRQHISNPRNNRGSIKNIHLEIQQTTLVFTTNDMLNNSSSSNNLLDITPLEKRRMSFRNIKNKVNNSIKRKNNQVGPQENFNNVNTVENVVCPENVRIPALSVKHLREQFQNGAGPSLC